MENNIALSFKIERTDSDISEMLGSIDKFSDYLKLPGKNAIHIRLITEEFVSMSRVLLKTDKCEISAKSNDASVEISLAAEAGSSESIRGMLVNISSRNKNAAYTGFTGMIRKALDESNTRSSRNVICDCQVICYANNRKARCTVPVSPMPVVHYDVSESICL